MKRMAERVTPVILTLVLLSAQVARAQNPSRAMPSDLDAFGAESSPQGSLLVAVHYYPWYTPERWDYRECVAGTLRGELLPAQGPALGPYDSRNQEVVTQHIAWSAAAGINVWAMEWIRPGDFTDDTLRNVILTNPRIAEIQFAIFYDYAIRFGGDFTLTPEKIAVIVSDFTYVAETYFSHPQYLWVDKGRPVVFFYVTRALVPLPAVVEMASAIREAIAARGFEIYILGDEYFGLNPPQPDRIGLWDGIFGYDVYMGYAGYADDNAYLERHRTRHDEYAAVAAELGVDFVPSLAPGYNDRAVRRQCANNPALARRTSADAPEGSLFQRFLQDISLPHAWKSRLKMISITSFNEWHEDTQIEPSILTAPTTRDTSPTGSQYTQDLIYQGYGTLYLDILREQTRPFQNKNVAQPGTCY